MDFTAAEFSTLMATNFESVFHISQLAYPLLKASGVGSIVFTSSVSGLTSSARLPSREFLHYFIDQRVIKIIILLTCQFSR